MRDRCSHMGIWLASLSKSRRECCWQKMRRISFREAIPMRKNSLHTALLMQAYVYTAVVRYGNAFHGLPSTASMRLWKSIMSTKSRRAIYRLSLLDPNSIHCICNIRTMFNGVTSIHRFSISFKLLRSCYLTQCTTLFKAFGQCVEWKPCWGFA